LHDEEIKSAVEFERDSVVGSKQTQNSTNMSNASTMNDEERSILLDGGGDDGEIFDSNSRNEQP
jgi:hypothetical protein